MEYISSDTNVWIDFSVIGLIELPFRLPYTYIMNSDAIDNELLSPRGLRDELLRCGLVKVELTIDEFDLAEEFGLLKLQKHNGQEIRLPKAEIELRLQR